jgi:hypothetical protein
MNLTLSMKMANRKADALKSLIQKTELDTPSLNFTNLVMEEVEAQEPVINPMLKALLKRNGIEDPSIDFTHGIIAQIEAHNLRTAYKPIISQKVWRIIISMVVFLVFYLVFSEQASKPTDGLTPYLISIGNTLNTILTNVNSVPSLYLITFISISALLVMDYLLRTRFQSHETKSRASL